MDNIDEDLFGSTIGGGSFQPSDDSWHEIRSTAAGIVKTANAANLQDLQTRKKAIEVITDELLQKETLLTQEIESLIDKHASSKSPQSASISTQI